MFERFTQDARAAVVAAQTIARESGARSIDSRHLLLALVDDGGPTADALRAVGVAPESLAERLRSDLKIGGLDADALSSIGIDLDAVRDRADAVFGAGALDRAGRTPVKGHLPFTAESKKALELGLREAVRLHRNRIDGAMLMLGIVRSTGSPAEVVLRHALAGAGSSIESLRSAVEQPGAQAS